VEITEVRIKLMDDPNDRLQGFCSITFDSAFVVRDLKIIQGAKGPFVAMPSRKLTDRCPNCNTKNHLRASHCNQCGTRLKEDRASKDDDGRAKLYADIAHPINSHCREMIQSCVLVAYEKELVRSKQPGYICTYDDYGEDRFADLAESCTPAVVAGRNDATHRIEPAAETSGGPHHSTGAGSAKPKVSAAAERSEPIDDGCGEGIV
jgi:stage V sporulation protein G